MFLKFGFVSHDAARLKISTNPLIASLLQLWSGLVWTFTCASQRKIANVKAHYTSNHIICLDFVWIATQRPKIVWIDPN